MELIYDYFRKQFEEYSGNKLDGRKGTPVDELMVKPAGLVMQEFYDLLVQQKRINSPDLQADWTEEEMDYFASKYFLFRTQGDTVSVTVRVYFDFAETFQITPDTTFVNDTNLQYNPVESETISPSSYRPSDIPGARFYIDFLCQAAAPGDQYQIEANKITGIQNANFTWKSVTNRFQSLGGSTHETNTEFWERLQYSLNTRALNSERSITATLRQYFPSINSLFIAGAGNPYMVRDLVSGVPQTMREKISDFRGKFVDSKQVPSICFQNVFPPAPTSSLGSTYWGPHSARSNYAYPLTIDSVANGPIDINSANPRISDPAFFGFPPEEVSDEQYQRMYFHDIVNKLSYDSGVLFDLKRLDLPFTFNFSLISEVAKIVPNENWVYGEHAFKNGVVNGLPDGVGVKDILNFTNNLISMRPCGKTISVGLDIKKFTGMKYSGQLVWSTGGSELYLDGKEANIQFLLGGKNEEIVDAFSGIGFGIKMFEEYDSESADPNATVYFSMDSRYGSTSIYTNTTDLNAFTDTTSLNALKETAWRVEPGQPYLFEFIINDNLQLTLFIRKEENLSTINPSDNVFKMDLPANVLQMYADTIQGIFDFKRVYDFTPPRFGSTMKITLESPDDATLETTPFLISNLRAFDINPARAQLLIGIDAEKLEAPFKMNLAAEATGNSQGYQVFAWDKQKITLATGEDELTAGGWTELGDMSNPDGTVSSNGGILSQTLQSRDRFVSVSRYGEKIFLLISPTGTSSPAVLYNGDEGEDAISEVRVDYVNAESSTATQFHSNTMADIYVNTWKNETDIQSLTQTVEKVTGEEFFEISRENGFTIPLAEILSVSITSDFAGRTLGQADYEIIYPEPTERLSGKEVIRLYTLDRSIDTITVNYIAYPDVMRMQDIFDDDRLRSAFGDMLAIHKAPVTLDISFQTAGDTDIKQMQDVTREYLDTLTTVYSENGLREYFDEREFTIFDVATTYQYNDEGEISRSGTVEESLTIKSVEFFKSGVISVNE